MCYLSFCVESQSSSQFWKWIFPMYGGLDEIVIQMLPLIWEPVQYWSFEMSLFRRADWLVTGGKIRYNDVKPASKPSSHVVMSWPGHRWRWQAKNLGGTLGSKLGSWHSFFQNAQYWHNAPVFTRYHNTRLGLLCQWSLFLKNIYKYLSNLFQGFLP